MPTPLTCRPRDRRLRLLALEDRIVPADLLVSTDASPTQQVMRQYTQAGALVQQATIPPGGLAEDARDLVADPNTGSVLVYNGTNDPYLSTYDPYGAWSHRTYPGWSTKGDVSSGGVAVYGNYAFVSDMSTFAEPADAAKGIFRFDRNTAAADLFATISYILYMTD